MVISIMLIICIPLTLAVEGYFILKAFELGKKVQKVEEKEVEKVVKHEPVAVDEEQQKAIQQFISDYAGF